MEWDRASWIDVMEADNKRMKAALTKIEEAIRDEIDGAIETQGRDTRLSHIIGMCQAALKH